MKKTSLILILLLLLPFCSAGDEPSPTESVNEESTETGSSVENNNEKDSSDSKSNDAESVKISNLRDKCEIFADSKDCLLYTSPSPRDS